MGKKRLYKSMFFALRGIFYAVTQERNMRIHLLATCLVIFLGWYFTINKIEWLILSLTISLVLVAETINSALERTVDLYSRDPNSLAGQAKDIAAGAVLLSAINAIIVGILIFGPLLWGVIK